MATRKTRSTKTAPAAKDPLARELATIANTQLVARERPPEGAEERLRTGWLAHEEAFTRGLEHATPEGHALWTRAQRYVAAGMPLRNEDGGLRDVDEQAAWFVASTQTHSERHPTAADFGRRWIAAGGLRYALEVGLRAGHILCATVDGWQSVVLVDCPKGSPRPGHDRGFGVLTWLSSEISRLDEAARGALRAEVASWASTTTAAGVASLAIAFDDGAWACEAVRIGEEEGTQFRSPAWPIAHLDALRDGEAFARLLGLGGAALQFFGPAYVLRAKERFSDEVMADALIHFFAASFAEPRRVQDTYAKRFAAIACTIGHPHVAWLFHTHGKHKWLKKHAALYAARFPSVVPSAPPPRALEARFVSAPRPPRPPGLGAAELAALDPAAREARLVSYLAKGNSGAAWVLQVLTDHPSPTVAVALYRKITHPDFATQMPRPGFHKELLSDLMVLGKTHPALGEALAAAKKVA